MTKDGKIRILQFPIANSKGGITQYVLQNWKFIDKSKFQFDFATMSKQLDFEDVLRKDGCEVFFISCYAEDDEEQFKKEFRNILKQGEYDIIHIHTKQWKSMFVEEIAKELGVEKIIVHAHSTGIDALNEEKREHELRQHMKVLNRLHDDVATDFWACSEEAANFLYGDRISKEKIKVMNNAIDLERFAFDDGVKKKIQKELGIKEDEYVVGNVGRMSHAKNQEFLLRVFKKLSDLRDDFKLVIVGDGELKEKLIQFVKENRLEDKVFFLGYRRDVNCLLQAFDVFCMPSEFEGLGIALIEAQASGVKCVVSEAIIDEAVLTDLVTKVPLKEDLWLEQLLLSAVHERVDYHKILVDAGYDIKAQIKELEKFYIK